MNEMIKILFFIEELRAGGAEKVLCNLVNAMDQNRFDITVQTLWKADAAQFLNPGIRYRYCYAARGALTRVRSRVEALLGLTYRLHIRDDYDIECAYLECGPTKIMASSTNRRAKKLAWVHCDLQKKMHDPEGFAAKSKKWYQKYDKVICVSQNVKDAFDAMFGNAFDTCVLYNTVDDAQIRREAEKALPDWIRKRRMTAVTVGRLTHQKAYDRLLRVHRNLLEQGITYDLWIIGEGPDRQAMEEYIAQYGLSDSVKLLGYQTNPYPFMKTADLLVCSSRYEGFSTFVTEGLILGKPIVTTDCTGMRELLGDGKYGMIVENEEKALEEGIHEMLRSDLLRDNYAVLARRRGSEFSSKRLTKQTEQYLLDLIED